MRLVNVMDLVRRTIFLVATVMALSVFGWARTAAAIEVYPGFVTTSIPAGRSGKFKLTLRSKLPFEKVLLEPCDYLIGRDGSVLFETEKAGRLSARSWCQLQPTELLVRAGSEVVFEVPIQIPPGTPGGEYYLGIKVRGPESNAASGGAFGVQFRASGAVLVIINVPGGTPRLVGEIQEETLKIEAFTPRVKATFRNAGTVSYVARMGMTIRGADRKVLDRFFMMGAGSQQEDGQAYVMPDGLRDFSGVGNRKLPSGKYTAEFAAFFGPKRTRVLKTVEFDVTGSPAQDESPIVDVFVTPSPLFTELPTGGVQYPVAEIKNRGFNTVRFKIESDRKELRFFPTELKLDPGKASKVRISLRLPRAEDPRRDLPVRIVLVGGSSKDQKTFLIKVFAPGTAPEKELLRSRASTSPARRVREEKPTEAPRSSQQDP